MIPDPIISSSNPRKDAMKERPILFSGPMVRAILAGSKTQTRRVVKGVPSWDHYGRDIMDWGLSGIHQGDFGEMAGTDRWFLDVQTEVDDCNRREIRCPYGAPGDRLWVREAWRLHERFSDVARIVYAASQHTSWTEMHEDFPVALAGDRQPTTGFKPSIHMPRWASRLTLEIADVRVERLQAISKAEARAEGVEPPETEREDRDRSICPMCGGTGLHGALGENLGVMEVDCTTCDTPAKRYRHLWEHINGPGSWDANPWVWVIEFQRVAADIPAIEAAA